MSFIAYFKLSKVALRAYRAQVVTRDQAPELYDIIDRLRQRAGLPMPASPSRPTRNRTLSRRVAMPHMRWSA